MPKKQKFYAVHKGKEPGVYLSWDRCQEQIIGYSGPIFKKCETVKEARYFVEHGKEQANSNIKNNISKYIGGNKKSAVYNGRIITVFTDGDLIKEDNEIYAGYGVWFGEEDDRNLSQPLMEDVPTNNRAEMWAVIEAIKKVERELDGGTQLNIYTDSQYVVQIFTGTGEKYRATNYKKKNGDPVPNADLVKLGMELSEGRRIIFHKVMAHTGGTDELSVGNSHADRLAMGGTLSHYLMTKQKEISERALNFGKYNGKKIRDVPENYLQWIASQEEFGNRIPLLYRYIVHSVKS